MPRFDFNEFIDRRDSDSGKWSSYDDDVLPLWVADMDFRSPEPVLQALHERVRHGVFGYGKQPDELKIVICERMAQKYSWEISPADVTFLPGSVSGLNVVARAIGERGDGVLMTTPIYPPFLTAPVHQHRELQTAQMAVTKQRKAGVEHLWYEMDFDALQGAITASTRLFLLCNPHNPVGRSFTRQELLALSDFCERYDLTICSDDNHCDLLLDGAEYTPIACLSPEIAQRTVTLIAPSKTFNLAGLKCGIAITQNSELRKQLTAASAGIVSQVNVLGYVAALAAYRECDDWVAALCNHLTENRDF